MKLSSLNFIESILPLGFRLFIRKQTKRLFGFLLFSMVVYLIISLISWTPYDPSLNNYNSNNINNILGASGAIVSDLMLQFIGLGSFILISILLIISLDMIIQTKRAMGIPRYIKYPIYFVTWIILLSNIDITDSNFFKSTINWSYLVGAGGLLGDSLSQLIEGVITANLDDISENNSKRLIFFISTLIIISTFSLNKLIVKINKKKTQRLIESDQTHRRVSLNRLNPLTFLFRIIQKLFLDVVLRFKSFFLKRQSEETSFEEIRDSHDIQDGDDSIVIGESIDSDISLSLIHISEPTRPY